MQETTEPVDIDFWKNGVGFFEYQNYYKSIENKLRTNPTFAFKYSERYGRIEEYEDVFLLDAAQAFLYAFWTVKGKLPPKIEKTFLKDPASAFLYAKHIYDGRLPSRLEDSFLLSAEIAYNYALFIGERLKEKLEKVFLKNDEYAYLYSKNVIKGKFDDKLHKMLFLRYTFDKGGDKVYLKRYFDENK